MKINIKILKVLIHIQTETSNSKLLEVSTF